MTTNPEAYYQFIMEYAPYVYVIPPNTPDSEWGRAAFAGAFAIDFLSEAYSAPQFENRRTEIYDKIVSLADWSLTQQCTDPARQAYGGFKSTETSTYYYTVDACRVIPALLKAYKLTSDANYLNAASLAGVTFLYNMQHKPSELGVHDKHYGDTPLLAGDKVHVTLPNENVDADFRVLSRVTMWTPRPKRLPTMELGREHPLLADYMFALRSKTDHLSRYKVARLI